MTVVPKDDGGEKRLVNKKGKIAVENPKFYIGCGVCAYKCPSQSLYLERREDLRDPPKDAREYLGIVLSDFSEARARGELEGP